MKQTAVLGAIGAVPVWAGCSNEGEKTDMDGKWLHHVFFWLKQATDENRRKQFRHALLKLASIETVRYKHIGMPASTNREIIDSTYTFSLLVVFDDEKGHAVYQEHPIHDEFREKFGDWWSHIQIYDTI